MVFRLEISKIEIKPDGKEGALSVVAREHVYEKSVYKLLS